MLRLIGRAGWNLTDQVLSAATNVALSIVVVRAAGAASFDAFAVAFLLFSTAIGIERSLVGQALSVRHSTETGRVRRRTLARATGTVVAVAVPMGLATAAAGALLPGQLGQALVATGSVLPLLVLQDVCRYAYFAAGQARWAAANDALWAVVQFAAMAALIGGEVTDVGALVLAWGGSAGVCVVAALVGLRVVPDPCAARSWLREHRDLVGYLLGDYLLTTGAFNGGYLVVGAVLGDAAVGSIRAAQVLLGPLGVVSGAVMSFGLPELSRRGAALGTASRWRIAVVTSTAMAGLAAGYGGVLLLVPDAFGELVFPDKWHEAQEVLLPLALAQVAALSTLGAAVNIYALGQTRRTFRIMTVEAPLVLVLLTAGALLFAVRGAVWGQLVDQVLVIGLWFATLRRVLAETSRVETSGEVDLHHRSERDELTQHGQQALT